MALNSDSDALDLQTIRDGLFFIVGPHRSGTTLLQAMLSSHSRLTVPPETGYFDQVWPRRDHLGPLTDAGNLARVGRFVTSPDCAVSDLQVDWSQVTAAVAGSPGGYEDLFVAILALYTRSRGKRRVGEKSPRHLFAIPELSRLYPQARFLFLIRDPRAVVRSERETSWGSQSVLRITRRWCRVVDAAEKFSQSLPAHRFRLVRYEDLVTNPETQLRSICEFLGETFEPELLRFQERTAEERGFRADEVWKEKTLTAVDVGRAELWRTALTSAEIKLIEGLAGSRLVRHGYLPQGPSVAGMNMLSTSIADRARWMCELVMGVLKGRSRRRPWSSVWRDLFS